jgi:hypothetical protein
MASATAQYEEMASLYRRAFEEFGVSALWPMNLENYRNHAGQRRGHWPGNSDIGAAMLEPYKQIPYK